MTTSLTPHAGAIYRHYKGGLYEVLFIGTQESTQEPCVIYQALSNNVVWVRDVSSWCERTEDGVERFTHTDVDKDLFAI